MPHETDIVERARWMANGEARSGIGKVRRALFEELADEIERLRKALDALVEQSDRVTGELLKDKDDEIERLRHPKIVVGSRKVWEAMGEIVSETESEQLTDCLRQNGELRRAYDEMFKRSCEKTVYIAECEDAIDQLRAQVHDLTEAVNIEYVGSVAQARNAALEEAAQVVEDWCADEDDLKRELGNLIRALKDGERHLTLDEQQTFNEALRQSGKARALKDKQP